MLSSSNSPHCSSLKNIGISPAHYRMLHTMTSQGHSNGHLTFLTVCLGSQNIICLWYQTRCACKSWHMQHLNCTQSFEGAEQGTARAAVGKQEPRAPPAQHTPLSMRHSPTEAVHVLWSQVVVTGSIHCPRHSRELSQQQKRWCHGYDWRQACNMDPKSILPTWPRAGLETSYNIWLGSIQETHYLEVHLRPMQEAELEKWASLTQLRHILHSQAQAQMRLQHPGTWSKLHGGGSDEAPLGVISTYLNRACSFFMLVWNCKKTLGFVPVHFLIGKWLVNPDIGLKMYQDSSIFWALHKGIKCIDFLWQLGRLLWACQIFYVWFCLNYLVSCQDICNSQTFNEVQWSGLHLGFLKTSPFPFFHWHPTRDHGHG